MKPQSNRVDLVLKIVHQVLKLEHLHLGYWEHDEVPVYGAVHAAQERFLKRLFEFIPQGTRSILDVGCGLGAGSRLLHDGGYEVEAVNPDAYQGQVFRALCGDKIPLHACRFETFTPSRSFDLALFSESSQYIPLENIFRGCRRVLANEASSPGGPHVLIADWFIRPGKSYLRGHKLEPFLAAARAAGFSLVREEDVTERVAPTLTWLLDFLEKHALPAVEVLEDFSVTYAPIWTRIVRLFARHKLERLKRFLRENLRRNFNPERFCENVCYRFYLFRLERTLGPSTEN